MADGRMLNKSISTSRQIKALENDTHRMLFAFAVPHVDRDGRMAGEADEFRAIVAPLLSHVTDEACESALWDFVRRGLAVRYTDANGRRVLAFPGFRGQQRHMKYEREAPSKFGDLTTPDTVPGIHSAMKADDVRHEGGVGPPRAGSRSAIVPDEVRLSEEKGSEAKGREGNARARDPDAPTIHCGDVVRIWNAVIRHAPIEESTLTYRKREDIAEWANRDSSGTGLPPANLLAAALRGFAADTAMQRKGYPFLIFAAQPSSFLPQARTAATRGGNVPPPKYADRTGMKPEDPFSEAGNG